MPQEELEKAVKDAAEKLGTTEEVETEEKQLEDDKVEEKKEKEEEKSEVDERTLQALQLYEALEDPKRAMKVVESLARQAGLLEGDTTKKEQKETIKGIKDLVREKLGENGSFFANELGEALEAIIQGERAAFQQKLEEIQSAAAIKSFETEFSAVVSSEKLTDAEANEIMKLTNEFPWNSEKVKLTDYLKRLIKFHRSEVAGKEKSQTTRQQQQKNINAQAKAQGAESNETRILKGSKTISPREAVEAALRGEKLE